ncbi:MAG: hypothetical protein ABH833_04325 [Parcubacteria group bacterium]
MLFFWGSNKKIVSEREFRDVRSRLRSRGLSGDEVDKVGMIFRADIDEPESMQRGIDEQEIERGIKWMRENTRIHRLSQSRIDIIDEELRKRL